MRPQTIGLAAAGVVTALFLATVGIVVVWPLFTPGENEGAMKLGAQLFNGGVAAPEVKPIDQKELPKVRGAVVPAKDYALSEPHTHGNLTVYLIHGKDTIKKPNIITLQEGIAQNLVVVRDTGVNLTIDNRSNMALFIQAGDIVKGGNQDRTSPYDLYIPAKTDGTPLAALCVEQGRSIRRGNESSESFEVSSDQLPTRNLKLAAYRQSQHEVWSNVKALQDDLGRNAGGSVASPVSNTSLQLSLEHHRVQAGVQAYLTALQPALEGKDDVIGFAVVINGRVQSADVYGSSVLFKKLWPKLIRASAVEALAEQHGAADKAADAAAVHAFLDNAEKGETFRVDANRATVIRHESANTLLHETCVPTQQNVVLHRSFLAK